ncbi:hypothetical protein MNQ98_24795 [Paenibacillus sp. N3/727]|uniref:hypothetical protein n=1 Tax=Paenibacillus sp. N3/727 TaxID=2925845 RepID=UPI001F537E20|nr:hypothetical protein [Paenibacillus sp. N3/727]UNK17640.1 hypothetical protein MNQ98_24795 [Paenibacillus sp. N3/727]
MGNPKTPNIGLNKIDRTSPATTYFDLEKYIDQNADSIDQFAGKVNEALTGVTDISQRFDVEKHKEVVLNAGMKILNAERSATFSLGGIKGRTLVNLLGRDGDCEDISKWGAARAVSTLDAANKVSGSNSIKLTLSAENTVGNIYKSVPVTVGKQYIFVGELKNGNATNVRIEIFDKSGKINLAPSASITDTSKFSTAYSKFTATEDEFTLSATVYGYAGNYAFIDGLRFYEISAAEYAAIDSMTPEQVAAEYPYVDSVQPVRNPYAIRYGENLLPPFYEWELRTTDTVKGPYKLSKTVTAQYQATVSPKIRVVRGQTYTLSTTRSGRMVLGEYKEDGTVIGYPIAETTDNSGFFSQSYTVDAKTDYIIVQLSNVATSGTFSFENPMLTIGSTPKPFKQREDAMLALQTDLYAHQVTGENADEVFDKDGQYFKLAKWKKVVLNDTFPYVYFRAGSGYKTIWAEITSQGISQSQNMMKFDGKILANDSATSAADTCHLHSNQKTLYVAISNVDSGWGDNYTPTADEIKAYFLGWKMCDGTEGTNWTTPYNRTDGLNKCWGKIYSGTGTNGTGQLAGVVMEGRTWTLPTVINDMGYTPYELVYQLAKPTVEPIESEGILTFNEGNNQVEVGTGIIVREIVEPTFDTGNWYINNDPLVYPTGGDSRLKKRAADIVGVYADNKKTFWSYDRAASSHGTVRAYTGADGKGSSDYDPQVTYSVTYLMLNKSPIVPFTGSYATNEKAILQDMVDVNKRISNVEVALQAGYTVVTDEYGSHGLRVNDGNLEYYNGSDWIRIVIDNPFPQRVHLHVDNINGNDNNDGLTEAKAFKTIKHAVSRAVKYYRDIVWIHCATTVNEKIELRNITNLNGLSIYGKKYNESGGLAYPMAKTPQITITGCTSSINVSYFEVDRNLDGYEYGITEIERNSLVFVGHIRNKNSSGNPAFRITSTTYTGMSNCEISNRGTVIEAYYGSGTVYSYNFIGTNNSVGLKARQGSTILKEGTQASAVTAEQTDSGGVIK